MLLILLVLNAFAANPITYKSYFTDNSFTTSEDWIITPTTSGVYSDCHNTRILGGYNNFGKQAQAKLSLTLPPHYQIRFTLEFWKIDSWDQEILFIQINGFNVHIEKFALEGAQLCGRQDYKYNELKKIIDRTIPHSNQQIEIIIKTSLDELANNESWGIRDFYLYLFECPSDCPQCNIKPFRVGNSQILLFFLVSEVAISTVFIIAPITLLFGGFRFIWPILDILNWINNFYFINVNYPENVKLIFNKHNGLAFSNFHKLVYSINNGVIIIFNLNKNFRKKMQILYILIIFKRLFHYYYKFLGFY